MMRRISRSAFAHPCRRSPTLLEGPKRRTQRNYRHKGDNRANYGHHDYVEIALAMRQAAQCQQRHHGAVGKLSSVPEPITATRCMSAGSMSFPAASSMYALPSASSAMVRPPEAEPVSAASTLVATASDTSSPPSIDSTQSRTAAKAGSAATTAPKPTRLAMVTAGNTEALAPASMLARNDGK